MADLTNKFFEKPILNSPYVRPDRHWELDEQGQPTQKIRDNRRPAQFITPVPRPRKRKGAPTQIALVLDEGEGLSTEKQQYDPTSIINELRRRIDQWRAIPYSKLPTRHSQFSTQPTLICFRRPSCASETNCRPYSNLPTMRRFVPRRPGSYLRRPCGDSKETSRAVFRDDSPAEVARR